MKNEGTNKKISPLVLIAIICQILFTIILVVVIHREITKSNQNIIQYDRPTISLDNLSATNVNLSNDSVDGILHSLTSVVELNTDNLDIPDSKAIVRDGSATLKEFSRFNFNALSFIVDIPDLKQSYQIYYNYPINPDNYIFLSEDTDSTQSNNLHTLCIEEESQIIYPDFNCHSDSPSDARYKIAKSDIYFLEFDDFTIRIDDNNPHQINLKPIIRVTDTLDETHIAQVKAAIQSLGISPDIFTYRIIESR